MNATTARQPIPVSSRPPAPRPARGFRNRMLRPALPLLFLLLTIPVPVLRGAADPVSALEESVREWLALRREWQRLQSDWQQEQRMLAAEEELLRQRLETLAADRAGNENAAAVAQASLREAVVLKNRLESALAGTANAISTAEASLTSWEKHLPPLLRKPLHEAFAGLAATAGSSDTRALAQRAQRVVALHTELQKLTGSVHAGRMILPDADGRERETEVLFLGMSVGYAVAAEGDAGAVGRPGAAGWTWQWQPELGTAVRRLLRSHRRDTPAALVNVPVLCGETAE